MRRTPLLLFPLSSLPPSPPSGHPNTREAHEANGGR